MNHAPTQTKPLPAARMSTADLQRIQAAQFNSAWGVTMPAQFDTTPQPTPFREAICGLVTREVNEPELLKLFFD
jgi:hypothetical protein